MPVSLSTWKHGFHPNRVTHDALLAGKSALDSVELGAKFCEADLTCMSVGKGGLPDTAGIVSLDASIMDHEGNCGAVAFVQHYEHAISIARRVMENTKYIMLAGSGAEAFAEREGFQKTELLTDKARRLYEQWMKQPDRLHVRLRRAQEGDHEYVFVKVDEEGKESGQLSRDAREDHDTIGLIAMDSEGRLAGACTTSGLAFKLHGRVGDSPIIGAGLYVDGNVAAAVATGDGELMMRSCASFHIVEQIRQGLEPGEALERTLDRIRQDRHLKDDMQCGLLVIRADGAWSARGLRAGFQFAAASDESRNINQLYDADEHGFAHASSNTTAALGAAPVE